MDSQEINTTEGNPPVSLQQPNFYNEYGQVQDPGVAHELADIEKSGKDSALKYEEVKKQEFETGLTEDETTMRLLNCSRNISPMLSKKDKIQKQERSIIILDFGYYQKLTWFIL